MIPEHENYSKFMVIEDVSILLQLGWKLGSHGLSHTDLTKLSRGELIDELQASKNWLENTFNKKVTEFSLPYGAVNEHVLEEAGKIYEKIYGINKTLEPAIARELIIEKDGHIIEFI